MSVKRTTFVVDIHDFVHYLEASFYRLSSRFPWLGESEPIGIRWPLSKPNDMVEQKTQRDYLLDWIIRRVLIENYYIDLCREEHMPEFEAVFDELQTNYQFSQQRTFYFDFPSLVGDIEPYHISRYQSWLYVDLSYNPEQQQRSYALRPSYAPL